MDVLETGAAATPPIAAKRSATIERHGLRFEDEYAWLRDPKWQEVMRDPEVLDRDIRAYLEAENAYTDATLAPTKELRRKLYEEMRARIKEDDSSVPLRDGPYFYYTRQEEGGEYPVYCRRRAVEGAPEEVLLDGNVMGLDKEFFRIGDCAHTPDHARIAYTIDDKGSEYFHVYARDLATGEDTDERIDNAQEDVVWANDGRTLFYVALDENHRPYRVYRHKLGDDPRNDALVYEEPDAAFYIDIERTESRRFIVISCFGHSTTSEVRCIDADAPDSTPLLIAPRETGVSYDVSHHGECFLITTNADGAVDFKIVEAPVEFPDRASWRDVVPHVPGRLIRSLTLFKDWMVWVERLDGLPRIVVRRLSDGDQHEIAFDEDPYVVWAEAGYEFETSILRFGFSSMRTPLRVYDYDMASRTRTLRKEQEVPSGHNPEDYQTQRVFAESHDGKRVPISLLYRKSTAIDGTAPLLLYGYGSYGVPMGAWFNTNRLSLVDRGFVLAVAHIRGGTDLGFGWYLDGKLGKKRNTFLDFIAAAEHLIAERYTAKGAIVAQGGSAGGMLMGAVANMRPDLFNGIVAEVPFVDVLNTMCDATLPLTPPEWSEWGNPIEDAEAFRYMATYSPYDNVRKQSYPNILATAGLTDPRVTYWEPAKWIARLRENNTAPTKILLHINMKAGHGGASGRFDKLEEVALTYAFALWVSGRAT
jgi:oligopeptidase B